MSGDRVRELETAIERVRRFARKLATDRGTAACEDIAGRLEYELGDDRSPWPAPDAVDAVSGPRKGDDT